MRKEAKEGYLEEAMAFQDPNTEWKEVREKGKAFQTEEAVCWKATAHLEPGWR